MVRLRKTQINWVDGKNQETNTWGRWYGWECSMSDIFQFTGCTRPYHLPNINLNINIINININITICPISTSQLDFHEKLVEKRYYEEAHEDVSFCSRSGASHLWWAGCRLITVWVTRTNMQKSTRTDMQKSTRNNMQKSTRNNLQKSTRTDMQKSNTTQGHSLLRFKINLNFCLK